MTRSSANRERRGTLALQFAAIEDPGTIWQRMLGLDLTALDGESQSARTDADESRRFRQVEPALASAPLGTVHRDLVMAAKCRDALASPEVAAPRASAIAVEEVGDERIGADARERTHRI